MRETAPKYLTAHDVSNLLHVSIPTVYRWTSNDPTIPAVRVQGTVRFPEGRLLRWLRDREQGRGTPRG